MRNNVLCFIWNSSQHIVSHGRCGNYLFKFNLMNDKLAEVSGSLDPGISATTGLGWAGLDHMAQVKGLLYGRSGSWLPSLVFY